MPTRPAHCFSLVSVLVYDLGPSIRRAVAAHGAERPAASSGIELYSGVDISVNVSEHFSFVDVDHAVYIEFG